MPIEERIVITSFNRHQCNGICEEHGIGPLWNTLNLKPNNELKKSFTFRLPTLDFFLSLRSNYNQKLII